MTSEELAELQRARRLLGAAKKALKGKSFGRFIRDLKKYGIDPKAKPLSS